MPEKKTRLRSIESRDLPQILEWRNSDRIRQNMFTDRIITMEEHLAWFEKLQEDGSSISLIFEFEDESAGVVNFNRIHSANHNAYWGFYLGKEDLPKGTGTLLGKLALKYAFVHMGLHKLCGEVFAFNEPSIGFHQKLGFVIEGTLKKHVWRNERYEDLICFAYFQESFLKERGCQN